MASELVAGIAASPQSNMSHPLKPPADPEHAKRSDNFKAKFDAAKRGPWHSWGTYDPLQVTFDSVFDRDDQSPAAEQALDRQPILPAATARPRLFEHLRQIPQLLFGLSGRPAKSVDRGSLGAQSPSPPSSYFPAPLPSGSRVTFYDSSYFTAPGARRPVRLPSPREITDLAERQRPQDKNDTTPFPVVDPSLRLIIKYGRRGQVTIAEGQCLWALRQPPVPKAVSRLIPEVYGWAEHSDTVFIYMRYIPSVSMESRLHDSSLSESEMLALGAQLASFMKAMQSLERQPDESFIGDIAGGPPADIWWAEHPPSRALPSMSAFYDWFCMDEHPGSGRPPFPGRDAFDDTTGTTFTHGDLHPRNILVTPAGEAPARILAVIDWHQSGWYPRYWEACKFRSLWRGRGLKDWNQRWGPGMLEYDAEYEKVWRKMMGRLGIVG